jgi:hypothetical protein
MEDRDKYKYSEEFKKSETLGEAPVPNTVIDRLTNLGFIVNEIEKPSTPNFKAITDSLASLLEYKNKKYGNSALEPLNVFSGKCKVGDRIDDKLARIKNSTSLKKNDIADLLGYAALICVENGWDNFDEFKD